MGQQIYDFGKIVWAHGRSRIELAARLGYAAKGLVYAIVGVLATMASFGYASGKLTGTRGAMEALNNESWGLLVLVLLTLGLTGFAIWRFTQVIRDTEDKGNDLSGLAQRTGLAISGALYGWLALYAGKLLIDHGGGAASSAQERAAKVMSHDGGMLLVGAVGVGFIGVGLYQLYCSLTARFKRNWKTNQMSARQEKAATAVSRFGIGARAIAFAIIGGFTVYAAVTASPQQARGMSGTLSELAQHTPGQWLVALAGAGLLCYGLYCFVNALFRRIDAGDCSESGHTGHATRAHLAH